MVKAGYCLLAHSSDDPCKLEGCLIKIKLRKFDSQTSVVQAHVVQSSALHAGLPGDSDAYHIAGHALLTFATIDGLGRWCVVRRSALWMTPENQDPVQPAA